MEDREYEPDTRGLAAPVFSGGGEAVAALAVVGSVERLSADRYGAIGEAVIEAARAAVGGARARDAGGGLTVPEYVKRADAPAERPGDDSVRDTVSSILLDIERRGGAAVRDWSLRLDGWAPETFLVGEREVGGRSRVDTGRPRASTSPSRRSRCAGSPNASSRRSRTWTSRASPACGWGTATSPSTPSGRTCPAAATRWSPPPS